MGGQFSDTYTQAHKFFVKRNRLGLKTPRANSKKAKTVTDPKTGKEKSTKEILEECDVSEIILEDEDGLNVSIFDTCDNVQIKINAHLRKPGITMAGFCRSIAEQYKIGIGGEEEVQIQHKQLKDFLEKKGATSGCTSKVFYGSYVYFEKLRLKQKKPKSKKRLEMENIHGENGLNIEKDSSHQHFWVTAGMVPYEDSYGKTQIQRTG